jgi:hypothetical protein
MQTFLPHGYDFEATARSLDQKRLVKQAVEGYQILRSLAGISQGWKNHPATKMWRGHEGWLAAYLDAILDEMERRGYSAATRPKIHALIDENFPDNDLDTAPPWLLDFRVSYTHKGRLYEKMPDHYRQFADYADFKQYACCDRCNYFWPTHSQDYGWFLTDGHLEKL